MLTMYDGRPEDTAGRLEKEIRVYDLLDSLQIPYKRVDHAAANTMEACKAIDETLKCTICKNLFLCNRQQTRFYLLMIQDMKKFKTKDISAQINSSRLSFGPADKMEEYLDSTPGSVSVMGLMNDHENQVQLLVDEDVLKGEEVGFHPCINTSSLKAKTRDIFEKYLPAVHHDMILVHL